MHQPREVGWTVYVDGLQANILAAIAWLLRECQASDSLFFSFSGHGCQPPHQGGGSWDEAILPCDFQQVCHRYHLLIPMPLQTCK